MQIANVGVGIDVMVGNSYGMGGTSWNSEREKFWRLSMKKIKIKLRVE